MRDLTDLRFYWNVSDSVMFCSWNVTWWQHWDSEMPFSIKAKLNNLLHQAVEQLEQKNDASQRDLTKPALSWGSWDKEMDKFGFKKMWMLLVYHYGAVLSFNLSYFNGTNPSQTTGKHHVEAIGKILSRKCSLYDRYTEGGVFFWCILKCNTSYLNFSLLRQEGSRLRTIFGRC